MKSKRDQRHELVAIDDLAFLVDDDQPVGIAIECDTDVGAAGHHRLLQKLRLCRSALVVDVESVRSNADRHYLGSELPQRFGRDVIRSAVGAIDHDFQAIEPEMFREGRFRKMDISSAGIVNSASPSDHLGFGKLGSFFEALLDFMLVGIAQLVSIRTKQLDPIVGKRIVRCGDHDADIRAH